MNQMIEAYAVHDTKKGENTDYSNDGVLYHA